MISKSCEKEYIFSPMTCAGYNGQKCWFSKKEEYLLCNSCQLMTDKEEFDKILKSPYDSSRMSGYIYTRGHISLQRVQDLFDTTLLFLFKHDKELLKEYIDTYSQLFTTRLYTHNDTGLCPIYAWMLVNSLYDDAVLPGCCLRCLAHTLRYINDDYTRTLILNSILVRNIEAPFIQSIIPRTKNPFIFYEFGSAILEVEGSGKYIEEFIRMIQPSFVVEALRIHPLLHKHVLQSGVYKESLYKFYKYRKNTFSDELIERAMEPSRVFDWCFDEDKKSVWKRCQR